MDRSTHSDASLHRRLPSPRHGLAAPALLCRVSLLALLASMALAGACAAPLDSDAIAPGAEPPEDRAVSGTTPPGPPPGPYDGGDGGAGGGGGGAAAGIDYCSACSAPAPSGAVAGNDVQEASGLVASAVHPGVLYTHNDAGNSPEVFMVGAAGEDLGKISVDDASATDWEDIARGPCPAGSCLYIADIGDNDEDRSRYTIYRIPEPASASGDQTVKAEAFRFKYPDGSHNAEALLVHPLTGVITLVVKVSSGLSPVYELELPPSPEDEQTATKVGEISPLNGSARFTGGDVHPEGRGVLLRTSTHALFYPASPDQRAGEALLGTPCNVPAAAEQQGESIAWTQDGGGYVTVSEGSHPALYAVQCGP